ncbi:hypothetical protein TELCIR_20298 [Teladorsagia circumcincta]|uniref:Amino acid transporter n=1 Tax=Teladorsagia circumcincta TaxID=45464 RepID=A0A2G9TLP7_TELCI|nr:hypothetical protein TELCIR_20298 [Teladorsagia circumcincta]
MFIVRGMVQAIVTAFGTASGGAALPVSMQCMEDNCHIDRRISRFVLPLGSTINMDGNALYEAVAVIFIAQLNNVDLSFAEVLTVRDRVRTSINVLGDGFAAGVVAHILQKRLDVSDARNDFRTEIKEEIGSPRVTNGGGVMEKKALSVATDLGYSYEKLQQDL